MKSKAIYFWAGVTTASIAFTAPLVFISHGRTERGSGRIDEGSTAVLLVAQKSQDKPDRPPTPGKGRKD